MVALTWVNVSPAKLHQMLATALRDLSRKNMHSYGGSTSWTFWCRMPAVGPQPLSDQVECRWWNASLMGRNIVMCVH
jgi:hypothetical protein